MSDCQACACGVPEDAVIVNQLHIVEYFDKEGALWKIDLSSGPDGNDLDTGKMFELVGWAQMMLMAPNLAEMVQDYIDWGDDDDEEGEPAQV